MLINRLTQLTEEDRTALLLHELRKIMVVTQYRVNNVTLELSYADLLKNFCFVKINSLCDNAKVKVGFIF